MPKRSKRTVGYPKQQKRKCPTCGFMSVVIYHRVVPLIEGDKLVRVARCTRQPCAYKVKNDLGGAYTQALRAKGREQNGSGRLDRGGNRYRDVLLDRGGNRYRDVLLDSLGHASMATKAGRWLNMLNRRDQLESAEHRKAVARRVEQRERRQAERADHRGSDGKPKAKR